MKYNEAFYECHICKEICKLDIGKEFESLKELKDLFGEELNEDHVRICDDCFNIVDPRKNPEEFKKYNLKKGQMK